MKNYNKCIILVFNIEIRWFFLILKVLIIKIILFIIITDETNTIQ